MWDVEKDAVTNFDFSSEKLPGTEYGLIRHKDDSDGKQPTARYRRYPSNVQWDPEDARLMALEIYLHHQKLELSASSAADDKTYDLLLTSRGVGDGDSTIAGGHMSTARDATTVNQEDLVRDVLLYARFAYGTVNTCCFACYSFAVWRRLQCSLQT